MQQRLIFGGDGPYVKLGPICQFENAGLEMGRCHRSKVAAYTIRGAWPALSPTNRPHELGGYAVSSRGPLSEASL